MQTGPTTELDLQVGDYYESCSYEPCLCIRVEDGAVYGISLVDGSYPKCCSVPGCGVRKLTLREALHWKFYGPLDSDIPDDAQWWQDFDRTARDVCPPITQGGG
jgi:hypothetical protein